MSDWPSLFIPPPSLMVPSQYSSMRFGNNTPPSSGSAWASANRAIYAPITLPLPYRVRRMAVVNHSTVSGNIDVGIYTANGTRIVSSGSTAQSGTSAPQFFDITDTDLPPGEYYLAVAMDNTTGGIWRSTGIIRISPLAGVCQESSAFPLPATATFATDTTGHRPVIAIIGGNVL